MNTPLECLQGPRGVQCGGVEKFLQGRDDFEALVENHPDPQFAQALRQASDDSNACEDAEFFLEKDRGSLGGIGTLTFTYGGAYIPVLSFHEEFPRLAQPLYSGFGDYFFDVEDVEDYHPVCLQWSSPREFRTTDPNGSGEEIQYAREAYIHFQLYHGAFEPGTYEIPIKILALRPENRDKLNMECTLRIHVTPSEVNEDQSNDQDNDFVSDERDLCSDTCGTSHPVTNFNGCSLNQACPCDHNWCSKASYLRCMERNLEELQQRAWITPSTASWISHAIEDNDCAKQRPVGFFDRLFCDDGRWDLQERQLWTRWGWFF